MPRKTQPQIDVVVTVAQDHLPKMKEVAARLKAKGLNVTQTMTSVGVISGTVPQAGVAGLNKVKGVAAVEQSGTVQIAPPGSDVQ